MKSLNPVKKSGPSVGAPKNVHKTKTGLTSFKVHASNSVKKPVQKSTSPDQVKIVDSIRPS